MEPLVPKNEMKSHEIWIEQCEVARAIESEFGTKKALSYLIGEKFINFLEAADDNLDFRAEIPAFVAEIKTIFERWQLDEFLETAAFTIKYMVTCLHIASVVGDAAYSLFLRFFTVSITGGFRDIFLRQPLG